jgi:hypothetical protein
MSHGPILLYDKSALQALSADEAFWLGMHYRTNLSPLFYVEVLADLEKATPGTRTPDEVVRDLARKVPSMGVHPNVGHADLVLGELLGQRVAMQRMPIQAGGRQVRGADGKVGLAFDEPPEVAAFNRWKRADFEGVERDFARHWRAALAQIDLQAMVRAVLGEREVSFRDLAAVKRFVDRRLKPKNNRLQMLRFALAVLRVPRAAHAEIVRRWKSCGGPPLWDFAPYSHYVMSVDTFFTLAVASDLVGASRATNKVDIAYLYYLPFCMIFTSDDKLHKRTVPLFMRGDQAFVTGADLKQDMAKLVHYYSALPDDVKSTGAMRYAAYPPLEGDYLTCRLFDRFLRGWRNHAANPIKITPELQAALLKRMRPMMDALEKGEAGCTDGAPEPDNVPGSEGNQESILKMSVHRDNERWRLF